MSERRTERLAHTGETTELLSTLIQNACVNDGTPDSGGERRNADTLQAYLEGAGLDVEQFTPRSDRTSIVARIEGSDPSAPKLCLMGHTDVVPVSRSGWSRDPFCGDVVDGEIWGRGAIDMLNITASMAVAFKELARTGFQPKGDIIYFGVADEEAGGVWGAKWMADHHWDAIACDYVLTEMGGWSHSDGRKVGISVGEKGIAWRRLTVKGTPGHGSMPYGADNAVLKAADVVKRLGDYRPAAKLDEMWAARVMATDLAPDVKAGLLDPARLEATLAMLPVPTARLLHACTHTTISPNVVHGGIKTNVIPDEVSIDVDIRTLPGDDSDRVAAYLREALGDLADDVEMSALFNDNSSISPMNNELWGILQRRTQVVYPEADLLPELIVGATDSRFFREKGTVAYGTGLFAPGVSFEQFASRFHGHDERIDIESLGLSTDYWIGICHDLSL
ncbi:MAG: M20/M25/M40 family metallo-hydrolase [Actinobacteria bacterium]|nr:M20/M25/M40 family metallo-hydrolase [Actinomycetota bacterium]